MEGHGHHHQVEAESRRQQQLRQEALPAFVAGDGSRPARPPRRPRVVRAAVDEDLYKVPSDMLRKKKGVHYHFLLLSSLLVFSLQQLQHFTGRSIF
jgi:hypothetical protein